jgi:GABA(A) receptor-associated protein
MKKNTQFFVSSTKNNKPFYSDFKADHTFNDRQMESLRMLNKYPDRVPVICQRHSKANPDCPYIDKIKYLIPLDLTLSQFIYVIRKRMTLSSEKALFVFINGTIPAMNALLSQIYREHQDEDGFLYINYNTENTFG